MLGCSAKRTWWVGCLLLTLLPLVSAGAFADGLVAPGNVQATDGVYEGAIVVGWGAVPDAVGYRVFRSSSPTGVFTLLAECSNPEFQDAAVLPCTIYWYEIAAYDASGEGPTSTAVSGSARAPVLPGPEGVAASQGTYRDKIRVSWDAVPEAQSYVVYRSEDAGLGDGSFTCVGTASGTSFDDEGLPACTEYDYRIATVNCDGVEGDPSSVAEGGYIGSPTISGLEASDGVYTDMIVLTWDPIPDAPLGTVYRVYRGAYSDLRCQPPLTFPYYNATLLTTTPGTSFCYTHNWQGCPPGHWFQFSVTVTTPRCGESPVGEVFVVGSTASLEPPSDVYLDVWASDDCGEDDPVVSVLGPDPRVTYVKIYRSVCGEDDYAFVGEVDFEPEILLSFTDTSTDCGVLYKYRASPCNGAGCGPLVGHTDCVVRSCPRIALAASDNAFADRVELTWEVTPSNYATAVERATSASGPWGTIASVASTDTRYDDFTAVPGVTYWYRLQVYQGVCGDGTSTVDSGSVGQGSAPALPAPAGIAASQGTYRDKIRVSWDAVPEAQSYVVYRSEDAGLGDGSFACVGTAAGTSFDDEGLPTCTEYDYRVATVNCDGVEGDPSSVAEDGYIGSPTISGLEASDGVYTDMIVLRWDPIPDAPLGTVYRVYLGAYGEVRYLPPPTFYCQRYLATTPGTSFCYTHNWQGCPPGHWFQFSVTVTTPRCGESPVGEVFVVGSTASLEPPSDVYLDVWASDDCGEDDPVVSVLGPDPRVTYVKIYRSVCGEDDYAFVGEVDFEPEILLSFTDTSTDCGVLYKYRASPCNGAGCGPLVGHTDCVVRSCPRIALAASDNAFADRVELTWEVTPSNYATAVERATSASGPWGTIASVASTDTRYDDFTAVPGVTYWYRLQVYEGGCGDGTSTVDSGSISLVAPGAPLGLAAAGAPDGAGIRLEWDAVPLAAWYTVYRASSEQGPYASLGTAVATSYLDATVGSTGSFWYVVVATNAVGSSDTSDPVGVVCDTVPPAVTVEQASGQPDPTMASPILFTATFSEPVIGFDGSGVTLGGTAGATTAVVTEVAPNDGTTYEIAVSGMTGPGSVVASIPADSAMDAAGNGNTASTSTDNEVTLQRLSAPPNLDASDGTYLDRIHLSWDGVAGANGYHLFVWNPGPAEWEFLANSAATSFDVAIGATWGTEAQPGHEYTYTVTAYVSGLSAVTSAYATEDVGWLGVPAPGTLQASDGTSTAHVEISWDAVDGLSGADVSYRVHRAGSQAGTYAALADVGVGTTSYLDTTATPGQVSWYRVQALVRGHYSALDGQTPDSGFRKLGVPQDFGASDGTDFNAIHLTWAPVSGADSYSILHSTDEGGPYEEIATSATASYDDTDAERCCGEQWYKVAACGTYGSSEPSAADSGYSSTLVKPTDFAVSRGTYSDRIVLTWDYPSGGNDPNISWKVYRSTGETLPMEPVHWNAYDTTWTDMNTVANTNYWYSIQAVYLPMNWRSGLIPRDWGYRDTVSPSGTFELVGAAVSDGLLSDTDVGETVTLVATFDEDMDQCGPPVWWFAPDVVASGTLVPEGSGSWVSPARFECSYTVADVDETAPHVDIYATSASDRAGNWMMPDPTVTADAFSVDTEAPPSPTVIAPEDGAFVNLLSSTLDWSAVSDGGGSGVYFYRGQLRDKDTQTVLRSFGAYAPAHAYANSLELYEGVFEWRVRSEDNAGNIGEYSEWWEYTIDVTPPTNPAMASTTHTVGVWSDEVVFECEIEFPAPADLSGVDGYEWAWDQSPTWAPLFVKNVEEDLCGIGNDHVSPDGAWYVHLATVDNAGNWSAPAHLGPFLIDTENPAVESITRLDASPTNADAVSFQVVFSEEVTGFDLSDLVFGTSGTVAFDPAVPPVTGSGDTYTVSVSNLSGDGVLELKVYGLSDGVTIYDRAGNLCVEDYTSGEMYEIDNTAPVLTVPPDATIECDASCAPSNTGQATAVDAQDPSPAITYRDSWINPLKNHSDFDRTWRAEDAAGNASEAVQTISVLAPSVAFLDVQPFWVNQLPATVDVSFTVEKCMITAYLYSTRVGGGESYYSPITPMGSVVSDGSTVNTQGIAVPAGAPEGIYRLTYIALYSESDCCSIYTHEGPEALYGIDLTPPVISGCPGDVAVDAWPGGDTARASWIEPTASDAGSGVASLTSSHIPGDRFPIGTTPVTYTATDEAGHSISCTFEVTVNATTAVTTPTGAAGILDRTWPEDEEPPMVGDLPLTATYEAGEVIGGSFELATPWGMPIRDPVVVTLYRLVEIGERSAGSSKLGKPRGIAGPTPPATAPAGEDDGDSMFERVALDAFYIYSARGAYRFDIETEGLEVGYYDIRLGLPDGEVQWLRIEVVQASRPGPVPPRERPERSR